MDGCIAMRDQEGNTNFWGKGQTKHIEFVIRQSKKTLIATNNRNKKKWANL